MKLEPELEILRLLVLQISKRASEIMFVADSLLEEAEDLRIKVENVEKRLTSDGESGGVHDIRSQVFI